MILKIFGISAAAVILYTVLKKSGAEYALTVEICAAAVLVILVLPDMFRLADVMSRAAGYADTDIDMLSFALKTTGISVVTTLAADICRDSGASALASKVEFAAKTVILASAVPFLEYIIENAVRLLG